LKCFCFFGDYLLRRNNAKGISVTGGARVFNIYYDSFIRRRKNLKDFQIFFDFWQILTGPAVPA
jgi:hypothetical protein